MPVRELSKSKCPICVVVFVCACSVTPEEGVYTCEDDSDCPKGWACFTEGDGRCYTGPEAFPNLDTGPGSDRDSGETDSPSSTDTDETTGSEDSGSAGDTGVDTQTGSDSEPPTDSDDGTGSDASSDTGSDSECKPEFGLRCGADGNVHWYDSCGVEGALFEECSAEHGACFQLSQNVAECGCESGWVGEDCTLDICTKDPTNKQSCATAFGIGRSEMPAQINDTTIDALGAVNVPCNGRKQPGKDVAFRLYLFAGETLDVSITPQNKDLSLLLFAESRRDEGQALCSEDTLVACSDNYNVVQESVLYEAQEDGWYFIVVDASVPFVSGAGAYHGEAKIIDPRPGVCYGD